MGCTGKCQSSALEKPSVRCGAPGDPVLNASCEDSSVALRKVKALLRFPPSHVARPVTYHLVKDYDLRINILHAQISSSSVGRLVMDIEGSETNLTQALSFLKGEGVEFELLNGSVSWNDATCVHCGACTAVCPAGCLTMDRKTWTLVFDKAQCLVCQACVIACPVGAMNIAI